MTDKPKRTFPDRPPLTPEEKLEFARFLGADLTFAVALVRYPWGDKGGEGYGLGLNERCAAEFRRRHPELTDDAEVSVEYIRLRLIVALEIALKELEVPT